MKECPCKGKKPEWIKSRRLSKSKRKPRRGVFNAIMSPIMGKKITLRKNPFTFTDKSRHQPKKD